MWCGMSFHGVHRVFFVNFKSKVDLNIFIYMSGPNISQTEFHRNHSWSGLFYSQTQVSCDWFSVYMSRLLVSEF